MIHIGLIVVNLEYVATSLCILLSNTGFSVYRNFLPLFPMDLVGQKIRFRLCLGHNLLENAKKLSYWLCGRLR